MTQNKIQKRIVRDYMDYCAEYHRELPYMEALRELASAKVRRLETWAKYPEYRSATMYHFPGGSYWTPRCRFGCMSEERAQHLGLCPRTDRDGALVVCFRCARTVCMACGAPIPDSYMACSGCMDRWAREEAEDVE